MGVDAAPGAVDLLDIFGIDDFPRRPLGVDLSMIYQDQAIAVLRRQVQIMKSYYDGQIIIKAKVLNQVEDFNLVIDIQIRCRLIQED